MNIADTTLGIQFDRKRYIILYLFGLMVKGQVTTLTKASSISESLRTTVPSSIVKQFGLQSGDKIRWELVASNREIYIRLHVVSEEEPSEG